MTKKITIWKSYGMYELKELEEQEKQAREFLEEIQEEDTDITEEDVTEELYNNIDLWFEDETLNLNKELNGRILAIANLGLWDGRRSHCKILGTNLNEVLTSTIGCDEKEVYCDQYNVCATGYHHDGYNTVEFREIREDRNIDNLTDKLYSGMPVTRREINYYTKSLRPYIKQIYGI